MTKELKLIPGQMTTLPTQEIEEHDLLKRLPPIAKQDAEVLKIADSIAQIGLTDPLKITPDGLLVDGRRRLRAAKRQQLETVPCLVVAEQEAALIIISCLECRAHMTKGQLAYSLAPMLEPSFRAAWQKRMANLQGDKATETEPIGFGETSELPKPLEEWAAQLGMSVDTLQLAHKVHRCFDDTTKRELTDDEGETEKSVTFRAFYEKRIFRAEKPYSLGGIIRGIAFTLQAEKHPEKKAKGGAPKEPTKQLELFQATFKDFKTRMKYWPKFDDEQKETAIKPLTTSLEEMPDDLLERLNKQVRDELRRRNAAKEGK